MKRILIIADGIVAKHFLHRIGETFISTNEYTVVTLDRTILPPNPPSNFIVYEFDPTSYIKLSKILKREFNDIFIILKNRVDAEGTYQNIRRDHPMVRITYFNRWEGGAPQEDSNLILVDANEILAGRLYDFLPNVPVIAQNVGLGQGEIMEVLVPFGSAYVYRHIGTIIQEQWRIVALYRGGRLVLPKPSMMIKPNDVLLLVGKPAVLESVFRAIKQEHGQFPAPFGENLYLLLDMRRQDRACIQNCLEQIGYLHNRMKGRRLIIRVVHPTEPTLLRDIRALDGPLIDVVVDYRERETAALIREDVARRNVGLIVCSREIFEDHGYRTTLYDLRKPVLRLAPSPLRDLNKLVLILSAHKSMEVISSTVFDVASQLELDVEVFDYEPDGDFEKKEIFINHYENLADIFSKTLHIHRRRRNPIRELMQEKNFLQILPFTDKMLQKRLLAYFSTDTDKLYFKLSTNPQLFVPVDAAQ